MKKNKVLNKNKILESAFEMKNFTDWCGTGHYLIGYNSQGPGDECPMCKLLNKIEDVAKKTRLIRFESVNKKCPHCGSNKATKTNEKYRYICRACDNYFAEKK